MAVEINELMYVCTYICMYYDLLKLHFLSIKVSLLWQRSVADPQFKRIFCLVYAEKLSFETSQLVVESLKRITQDKRG